VLTDDDFRSMVSRRLGDFVGTTKNVRVTDTRVRGLNGLPASDDPSSTLAEVYSTNRAKTLHQRKTRLARMGQVE
jgi:hypothetical protein